MESRGATHRQVGANQPRCNAFGMKTNSKDRCSSIKRRDRLASDVASGNAKWRGRGTETGTEDKQSAETYLRCGPSLMSSKVIDLT